MQLTAIESNIFSKIVKFTDSDEIIKIINKNKKINLIIKR